MALMANDGYARAIVPSHTLGDGDTIFALATGRWQGDADVTSIGALPFTGLPLTTTFVYKDSHDHRIQITIGGNTTAEFIGVAIPGAMGGFARCDTKTSPALCSSTD